MCEEWCMQFIDAGRLPINDEPLWTTNNYTERINRTIEATYSGKQTVLTFVERLYGVKLIRENIAEERTGKLIYEAGLVTNFNMQSVEQVSCIFYFIFFLYNLNFFILFYFIKLIARFICKNDARYA
jgi:hypothetical protein